MKTTFYHEGRYYNVVDKGRRANIEQIRGMAGYKSDKDAKWALEEARDPARHSPTTLDQPDRNSPKAILTRANKRSRGK